MRLRKFGRTDLVVTELGLGGSPLGNRGTAIREPQADAIVESAWNQGIRYFDTAPLYGHGLAEARLGHRAAMEAARRVRRFVEGRADTDSQRGARRWTTVPGRAVCRSNAATTIPTTARGAHSRIPCNVWESRESKSR